MYSPHSRAPAGSVTLSTSERSVASFTFLPGRTLVPLRFHAVVNTIDDAAGLGDDREYVDITPVTYTCSNGGSSARIGGRLVNGISTPSHQVSDAIPWHILRIYINESEKFRGFIITPSGTDISDPDRDPQHYGEDPGNLYRRTPRKQGGWDPSSPQQRGTGRLYAHWHRHGLRFQRDGTSRQRRGTAPGSWHNAHRHTDLPPQQVQVTTCKESWLPPNSSGTGNRTLTIDLSNLRGPSSGSDGMSMPIPTADKVRLDTRARIRTGHSLDLRDYTRRETRITITVTD